jgi:hypothetical protein
LLLGFRNSGRQQMQISGFSRWAAPQARPPALDRAHQPHTPDVYGSLKPLLALPPFPGKLHWGLLQVTYLVLLR